MCHDASKTTRSCEDGSDALRLCNWAGVTTRGQLSPNIVAYDLRLAFRAKLGTRRASTRANMGAESKIKAVSLRHSCEREHTDSDQETSGSRTGLRMSPFGSRDPNPSRMASLACHSRRRRIRAACRLRHPPHRLLHVARRRARCPPTKARG